MQMELPEEEVNKRVNDCLKLLNIEKLKELGFEITLHDKMPDVVLYREDKNWIYFIESVTSVGPMDPKRILEITEMTKDVTAGKIFVTAFLDLDHITFAIARISCRHSPYLFRLPK